MAVCKNCNNEFQPNPRYRKGNQMFCCKKCKYHFHYYKVRDYDINRPFTSATCILIGQDLANGKTYLWMAEFYGRDKEHIKYEVEQGKFKKLIEFWKKCYEKKQENKKEGV